MMTWSPTHLQPVGVPCCQRSYNHPGCRNEKNLDGYVVYEHQASSTEKKLDQVLLISACSSQNIRFWAA